MAELGNDRTAVRRILDLTFFGPIGLAVTIGEAVPKLTSRGREVVGPQLTVTRTLGEMAVAEGRHRLDALWLSAPFRPKGRHGTRTTEAASKPDGSSGPTAAAGFTPATSSVPSAGRTSSPAPGAPATPGARRLEPLAGSVVRKSADIESAAGHITSTSRPGRPGGPSRGKQVTAGAKPPRATQLAIPSYDALSASQVVQRLAGLSLDEVRAVRAYEAAGRGRRTILSRADQLLA